jgi:hypothetical protein
MKTRQLANVLIKVLGLSIVAHSIPAIISATMTMLIAQGMGARQGAWFPSWFGQITPLATLVIGIVLIVASRSVTGLLFKKDDDA